MILRQIAFRHLLGKGELIYRVAHKHPFKMYGKWFKSLSFGVFAPAIGYYLMPPFKWMWLAWAIFGITIFLYRITQWYLDAWVITNYGVIDQEWESIFNKQTVRIEYGNIEGVTTEIKGFWGTVLGFGKIQIEHMSGASVELDDVSRPRKVESLIIRYQQDYNRQQNFEDHSKLKDLLASLLRNS